MTTSRRLVTGIGAFVLLVSLASAARAQGPAAAGCPTAIPPGVMSNIRTPQVRDAARMTPPLTPATFAMFGGLQSMIAQTRAQLADIDRVIAEEQRNRGYLAQQGAGDFESMRHSQEVMQAARDTKALAEATLNVLNCHAGNTARPGVTGRGSGPPGTSDRDAIEQGRQDYRDQQAAIVAACGEEPQGRPENSRQLDGLEYAGCSQRARDAFQAARGNSSNTPAGGQDPLVDPANPQTSLGTLPPEVRNTVSGSPTQVDGLLDDLLSGRNPTAVANGCQASVSATNVSLANDGTELHLTLNATHTNAAPCTVTFGGEVRSGSRTVEKIPVRTITVPPGGLTANEAIVLRTPVQLSAATCARIEPITRALLETRDQQTADYEKWRAHGLDSVENFNRLQRTVGLADLAEVALQFKQTVSAMQLLLSGYALAGGAAATGADGVAQSGACVTRELISFTGKAMNDCTDPLKSDDDCVNTVRDDGTKWVAKNVACLKGGLAKTLSSLTGIIDKVRDLYNTKSKIDEVQQARENTISTMQMVVDNVNNITAHLRDIRQSRAIVDDTIGPLIAQCRSPQLQFVVTEITSNSGK